MIAGSWYRGTPLTAGEPHECPASKTVTGAQSWRNSRMNKDERDSKRDEALGIYTDAELQDRREKRAIREYQRKQAERESLEK